MTDRHNTLQIFDMEGKYPQHARRLWFAGQSRSWQDLLVVPELLARVTLLGPGNEVVARLGDDVERISNDKGFQHSWRREPLGARQVRAPARRVF
ncbi:MAG: hypothetical protein R3B96_04110 [Pirellulaceae bacterium]